MVEAISYRNEIIDAKKMHITLLQRNSWSNTLSQWTSCGNKWNYHNKNLVAIYDIYCNDVFCCENLVP